MNNTDKATNGSTRKDSDANRDYYQQMYDKIHISQDLEERLMDMYKMNNNVWKQKKSTRRTAWKVVAAVAALSIVVPTGAYAASHYFGIADFFSLSGRKLNQDANKLIEKEITQIPEKETASELPVTFTVQEALCDSGTVNIVVEAKANERGKYLLVPQDALESDSVENLGIDSTKTIAEYAKEKNLEILHVDSGFKVGSPYFPGVSSYYNKSLQDDVMEIGITAEREKDDTQLDVVFENAVWKSGSDDIKKSDTTFHLQDNSSSEIVQYHIEGSKEVAGTHSVITKVEMEKTEVHTYVTVYYVNSKPEIDDGLVFRVKDSRDGSEWQFDSGSGVEDLGNGNFRQRMVYGAVDFPEQCVLEAFNCYEKNIYGQFDILKK